MDQLFSGSRFSLDSVRSSILQPSYASTSSFVTPSFAPVNSVTVSSRNRWSDPDPTPVFRDANVPSFAVPFNPAPQLFPNPLVKEKLATRSAMPVSLPSISQGLSLLRSCSAQSVSDVPASPTFSLLPGEGYACHPSIPSIPSSIESPSRSVALKRLFTVRSLLRLLPASLLEGTNSSYSEGAQADMETEDALRGLGRKRKATEAVCRGFDDDTKRRNGVSPSPAIAAYVVSESESALTRFLDFSALTFAEYSAFETSSASLMEALHVSPSDDGVENDVGADMDDEIDELCNGTALDPHTFADQLTSLYHDAESASDDDIHPVESIPVGRVQPHTISQLRERFAVQAVDELVVCVDVLHEELTSPASSVSQKRVALYRVFMALLFAFACRDSALVGILDRPRNRKQRNAVISSFFKSALRPVLSSECNEVVAMSKAGLAYLDSKQRKIPRDVVESVLRPALLQFCDHQKVDMRLIIGLHAIVELFPTLFKEVFARKILDTLSALQDDAQLAKFLVPRSTLADMIIYLLDFFRLFAATGAFSCSQWIEPLTHVVASLEAKWAGSLVTRDGSGGCQGFRCPLCRLACHYPEHAASLVISKGSDPSGRLLASLLSCRHSTPVKQALTRVVGTMTGDVLRPFMPRDAPFADVVLVASCPGQPSTNISAHRVVLASRSDFFRALLCNGMLETGQSVVMLENVRGEDLNHLLDFLYSSRVEDMEHLSIGDLIAVVALADRFLVRDAVELAEYLVQTKINSREAMEQAMAFVSQSQLVGEDGGANVSRRRCGGLGAGVLRGCQTYLVNNLGTLAGQLDWRDPTVVALLAAGHADLLVPSSLVCG